MQKFKSASVPVFADGISKALLGLGVELIDDALQIVEFFAGLGELALGSEALVVREVSASLHGKALDVRGGSRCGGVRRVGRERVRRF